MRRTQEEQRAEGRLEDFEFLDNLGTGGLDPTDAELAEAPVIFTWRINDSSLMGLRVDGLVRNHPVVEDGPISTTAPQQADTRRGWMKTRNTLYRLGEHL